MNNIPPLRLENLSRHFSQGGRRIDVLNQANLELYSGQMTALVGPSGAGKTTLLRIAMGLLQPTSGEIFLRSGLRIGYLPQKLHVDPTFPLTVNRFLAMAKQKEAALAVGVGEALEEVGVSNVIDSPLQSLSGGELQRVLLARALIRRPELLVLDEPLHRVRLGDPPDEVRVPDLGEERAVGGRRRRELRGHERGLPDLHGVHRSPQKP